MFPANQSVLSGTRWNQKIADPSSYEENFFSKNLLRNNS
jgi:hypothetical protein